MIGLCRMYFLLRVDSQTLAYVLVPEVNAALLVSHTCVTHTYHVILLAALLCFIWRKVENNHSRCV